LLNFAAHIKRDEASIAAHAPLSQIQALWGIGLAFLKKSDQCKSLIKIHSPPIISTLKLTAGGEVIEIATTMLQRS
jgi:hypothetical protein